MGTKPSGRRAPFDQDAVGDGTIVLHDYPTVGGDPDLIRASDGELIAEPGKLLFPAAVTMDTKSIVTFDSEELSRRERWALEEVDRKSYTPSQLRKRDRRLRWRQVQALLAFVFVIAGVLVLAWMAGEFRLGWYGVIAISYLGIKIAMATAYRPYTGTIEPGRIAVVVPLYNEDPEVVEQSIRSILRQTRPVDEIWVVDDGSSEIAGVERAQRMLADIPTGYVFVLRENRGKRFAQTVAFERSTADIFVTIDSDTVLDPRAVEEGLRAMSEPHVYGATANVRVLNAETNLLTRLIDLRYANAFMYERAAYSTFDSVLCCCGSLSFWRREVILDNIVDYVNQSFLGVPVGYGDDRRLTNYALARGAVRFQETSIAYTVVPERFNHFVRQQTRWNKSFFRESLWVMKNFSPRRMAWWLSMAEMVLWVVFSITLVLALLWRPIESGIALYHYYLGFLALMAYARSVRFIGAAQEEPLLRQVVTFVLAPLYGLLHILVLIPLRIHSISSIRDGGWGTRETVEVTVDAS